MIDNKGMPCNAPTESESPPVEKQAREFTAVELWAALRAYDGLLGGDEVELQK